MQLFSRVPVGLSILATSALAGVATYLAQRPAPVAAVTPSFEVAETIAPELAMHADPAAAPLPRAKPALPFAFAMRIGDVTYVTLPATENEISVLTPRKLTGSTSDYGGEAVGALDASAIPSRFRGLLDTTFTLGDACTGKVTGFALAARLTGDVSYAAVPGDSPTWKAKDVMHLGGRELVARLDAPCGAQYARDASLPPLATFASVDDQAHLAEARRLLLASTAATTVDRAWNDKEAWGDEATEDWRDVAEVDARVFEHARTHVRWAIVHLHRGGACGERSMNLLGVYQVSPSGKLVPAYVSGTFALDTIEALLDTNLDGVPEILGAGWLGPEHQLRTLRDEVLDEVTVPFYGCPC